MDPVKAFEEEYPELSEEFKVGTTKKNVIITIYRASKSQELLYNFFFY